MAQQHGLQGRHISQQTVQGRLRDLGEGGVVGREDGEGTGALQRADEIGGLKRRHQSGEVRVAHSNVDDGLGGRGGGACGGGVIVEGAVAAKAGPDKGGGEDEDVEAAHDAGCV